MSARPRLAAFLLLAVLVVAVSLYTVGVQPDGVGVTEAYPVGLLAGAGLLVPRRWRPWLVPVGAALGCAVYLTFGRPVPVAVGWSLAAALGAWVATEVLTGRGRRGAKLLTEDDLRRFVAAGFAGATTSAFLAAWVALATGFAEWWMAAIGVLAAHFATYLVLMPHFMGRPRYPGVAPLGERTVQWTLTVVLAVAAFLPWNDWPSLAFCLIPCLGWSALRAPMRETLVQLLVVATASHAMTSRGMGPFAAAPDASVLRADLLMSCYALFICACALTAIPFALAVGVQRRETWKAQLEQTRVEQLVQSASGVAIIGTDAEGRIDLFNPGAEQILGYDAGDVMGLAPSIVCTPREIERLARRFGCRPSFVAVALRLAASGEQHDVEFVRKDGRRLTMQFSVSRIRDESGRVSGFVTTGEDVTDRVNRQRALEEALLAEQAAVENLREVDQVKDALVSGVSHELRTPITSILGYLEVLEDGGFGVLTPQQRRALGRVRGNSNRLLALIDDLLMLSRVQEGYLELEHASVDLKEVAVSACAAAAPTFAAVGVELRCVLSERDVRVFGDPERLGRVVGSLLDNAVKFTDAGGLVELRLAVEGQAAVLTITDSGIGIPEQEQERVFDRFFRAAAARQREIQGSGLGLSVAKALVQSHGGRIEVESEEGHGSSFKVRLPLEGCTPIPEQDRARVREASRVR